MIAPAELRTLAPFTDLGDDDLAYVASAAEERVYAPGEPLAVEGSPADAMFAVLSGEVRFRQERVADGRIFLTRPGELTGLLPFSRMTAYVGTLRATQTTRVARFPSAGFAELLRRVPVLEQRFVSLLADRVREATRAEQQHEKLMALGKLSAGLAHEMNNPAAALRRGTAHLREVLASLPAVTVALSGCNLNAAQFSTLAALLARKIAEGERPRLAPVEQGEREDAVGEWLGARSVPDPWVLAGMFVTAGIGVDELDGLARILPATSLRDAMAWLGAGLSADRLLREMEDSSRRISELVASVKSYSRMDEPSARAEVDVHEGVESTLLILGHKVRERKAVVERDFDPALPRIVANAGELNQVWTNLIDNALDAVAPGGKVTVRTRLRGAEVVVEVHDDGAGVPPEVASRVWEPFFTTKEPGEGTGLGLDIARRIVVRQHGGSITLQSMPGDTCFQVRLPVGGAAPPPTDDEPEVAAAVTADVGAGG